MNNVIIKQGMTSNVDWDYIGITSKKNIINPFICEIR